MIALRMRNEEEALVKSYARLNNKSVSEVVRSAILDRIEDEYDVTAADEAYREYLADPVSYTTHEVAKELGF